MDFDDKVLRCLHKNAESRGSNDQQNEMTARIFVAVFSAESRCIGETSGLYLFPGLGLAQTRLGNSRESYATYGREVCEQSLRPSRLSPARRAAYFWQCGCLLRHD